MRLPISYKGLTLYQTLNLTTKSSTNCANSRLKKIFFILAKIPRVKLSFNSLNINKRKKKKKKKIQHKKNIKKQTKYSL